MKGTERTGTVFLGPCHVVIPALLIGAQRLSLELSFGVARSMPKLN